MSDSSKTYEGDAQEAQGAAAEGQTSGQEPIRTLGQPLDTVSSATREMFEVRSASPRKYTEKQASQSDGATLAFKVIAVIAIVALAAAIVVTQLGAA